MLPLCSPRTTTLQEQAGRLCGTHNETSQAWHFKLLEAGTLTLRRLTLHKRRLNTVVSNLNNVSNPKLTIGVFDGEEYIGHADHYDEEARPGKLL